jgi:hypothetical protein
MSSASLNPSGEVAHVPPHVRSADPHMSSASLNHSRSLASLGCSDPHVLGHELPVGLHVLPEFVHGQARALVRDVFRGKHRGFFGVEPVQRGLPLVAVERVPPLVGVEQSRLEVRLLLGLPLGDGARDVVLREVVQLVVEVVVPAGARKKEFPS